MKTNLEYNGNPATWQQTQSERTSVFVNGLFVERGQMVTVCAWCDTDSKLTRNLAAAGYEVSHGCCEACDIKARQHTVWWYEKDSTGQQRRNHRDFPNRNQARRFERDYKMSDHTGAISPCFLGQTMFLDWHPSKAVAK